MGLSRLNRFAFNKRRRRNKQKIRGRRARRARRRRRRARLREVNRRRMMMLLAVTMTMERRSDESERAKRMIRISNRHRLRQQRRHQKRRNAERESKADKLMTIDSQNCIRWSSFLLACTLKSSCRRQTVHKWKYVIGLFYGSLLVKNMDKHFNFMMMDMKKLC